MIILGYKVVYLFSLFMLCYVYIGYPVCVWIASRLMRLDVNNKPFEPLVTILIAAYNEEEQIGNTIANKLQLDYPKDKLQIIVISDGSTDKTDEIAKSFSGDNVVLIRQDPRAGKTSALNLAIPYATGEILVFSDANSIYAADALKHIASNFYNPQVGYVTGKMIYTNHEGKPIGDGCSAYMKYENVLRSMETKIGSVVGVDGGIDSIRASLYSNLNPDQLPDFVQPLKVVEQGYRVIYEPKALLRESSLTQSTEEYRMRVRVCLRSLWALYDMRQLLWGECGFMFAWQLWSHKVFRYLVFLFLLGAYITNILLWTEAFIFKIVFVAQTVCYFGGLSSYLLEKMRIQSKFLSPLHYFILLNLAAAHASLKFILGKKQVIWTPRKG